MTNTRFFLGIDFGTSGARTQVIAGDGAPVHNDLRHFGVLAESQCAPTWREALWELITALPAAIRTQLVAVAIDGTSGTVLACDRELRATFPALLYNDARATIEAQHIKRVAPAGHPAAAATSGLAKVLWLKRRLGYIGARLYLNQADWLSGLLTEQPGFTDFHNALKMGLDLDSLTWPGWMASLIDLDYLPKPVMPGTPIAAVSAKRARYLGIHSECVIRAGTTDSIAAFLASGAHQTGQAVTSLGSTTVLKLLSDTRVESAEHGVYSHWFGRRWLAGGASNAGGAVLRQFFDNNALAALSARINPDVTSPLDYMPLPAVGERFPINDPQLAPRLTPRPADDAAFLHGILQGLTRIEVQGYQLLKMLGASALTEVMTAGGGAQNVCWQQMRQNQLGVPIRRAKHTEAAYGTARLAREGAELFNTQ